MTAIARFRAAPRLTAEEEAELVSRMAAGDRRARDMLILRHISLASKMACRYAGILSQEDAEGAAFKGLCMAAEAFDPARGARFVTTAHWWIRNELNILVRKTFHVSGRRSGDRRILFPLSLDAPCAGSDSGSLGDMVIDEDALDETAMIDRLDTAKRKALLRDALTVLDERERWIVTARYPLDGGEAATLNDLHHAIGISRERVRQIEVLALAKIADAIAGFLAPATPVPSDVIMRAAA